MHISRACCAFWHEAGSEEKGGEYQNMLLPPRSVRSLVRRRWATTQPCEWFRLPCTVPGRSCPLVRTSILPIDPWYFILAASFLLEGIRRRGSPSLLGRHEGGL